MPETDIDIIEERWVHNVTVWYSRFSSSGGKWFRPVLPWLFGLAFIWIALAIIPIPPQIMGTGLDPSWVYALNLAHSDHLLFGRDVVITFGPLGYLFYPIPDLVGPVPVIAYTWMVYTTFLAGLLWIWRALGHRLTVIVSWAVLGAAMLLTEPFWRIQISFLSMALGILALFSVRTEGRFLYLAITGVFAGLMTLFKLNEATAACTVFYALLIPLSARAWKDAGTLRYKVLTIALLPPISFLVGFIAVERNVSGIWNYVVRSMNIVTGFSEAMSSTGPEYQVVLALFGIVFLALVIPSVAERPRDLAPGFLPGVLCAFFIFKSGIVRQDDPHVALLHVKLAVAGLFLLICARTVRDRRLLMAYVAGTFCLGISLYGQVYPMQLAMAEDRSGLRSTLENLQANLQFSATWKRVGEETRQALTGRRLDPVISKLVSGGTVDDVPHEVDIVAANGWRWNPRPVFQSYSAYTPVLDKLNASHLADGGADHIIMHWDAIDGRNPLLDDAASWRSLFDHYDVEFSRADLLVLERRQSPRYYEPRRIGTVTGAWNRDITVPQVSPNEFAMMKVETGKSLWGGVMGLTFRNSPVYVAATYVSGRQSRWRVTRANLADGAFIGYLPQNLGEALPYFGQLQDGVPDRMASIRFESPGLNEFSSTIRISWYAVAFRPGEAQVPPQPRLDLIQLWKPGDPVKPSGSRIQVEPSSLVVRPFQRDPQLHFNLGELGRYKTVMVRARFRSSGRIDAFFGRQVEGRGIGGYVPALRQWVDIYLNMAVNPFWPAEAGSILRFDPPDDSVGSTIEIAGIWASVESFPKPAEMTFYTVADPILQAKPMPPEKNYEGLLVRRAGGSAEDSKVYLIRDGKKDWVWDAKWIKSHGFKWPDDVHVIPARDLASIPTGKSIP